LTNPTKKANISKISPLISPKPSKKVLERSKFYKGKDKTGESQNNAQNGCFYAQASKSNIKDIIKIKDNFPNLLAKKIEEVYKVLNEPKKDKLRLNIITKKLSRRQVLVLMSLNNAKKLITLFSKHVANINRVLKNIKLDVVANLICANNRGITITTNKVAFTLDLNIIEKYIKNVNAVNSDDVMLPRLPQSKSYFKILGILYLIENMNIPISADVIERVLQLTHIFNDIVLMSKPHVIKVFPKSDMTVI